VRPGRFDRDRRARGRGGVVSGLLRLAHHATLLLASLLLGFVVGLLARVSRAHVARSRYRDLDEARSIGWVGPEPAALLG